MKETADPAVGKLDLPTPAPVAPPAGSLVMAPSLPTGAPWDREEAARVALEGERRRGLLVCPNRQEVPHLASRFISFGSFCIRFVTLTPLHGQVRTACLTI